jgi:hypothetical protein
MMAVIQTIGEQCMLARMRYATVSPQSHVLLGTAALGGERVL